MNHVMSWKFSRAGDRGLTDSDRTVCIAFLLDRRAAAPADRSGYTTPEHEVVVCGIDNRVDVLLDQVAVENHDPRRMQASTSATRSSNSSRVAFAMPLTPIAEMVIDAHATPHTS